jgi:hypothetical protein
MKDTSGRGGEKMELHQQYIITGKGGSVCTVKVLSIGKTFVTVQNTEGKYANTEPYLVLPSEWEWQTA